MFKDVKDMHACMHSSDWMICGEWRRHVAHRFFFFFFHLLEESLCLDYEIMNHDVF